MPKFGRKQGFGVGHYGQPTPQLAGSTHRKNSETNFDIYNKAASDVFLPETEESIKSKVEERSTIN